MAKNRDHKKKTQEEALDSQKPSSSDGNESPISVAETRPRPRSSRAKRMSGDVAFSRLFEQDPSRADEDHQPDSEVNDGEDAEDDMVEEDREHPTLVQTGYHDEAMADANDNPENKGREGNSENEDDEEELQECLRRKHINHNKRKTNVLREEANSESDDVFDDEELKEWEKSSRKIFTNRHKRKPCGNVLREECEDDNADNPSDDDNVDNVQRKKSKLTKKASISDPKVKDGDVMQEIKVLKEELQRQYLEIQKLKKKQKGKNQKNVKKRILNRNCSDSVRKVYKELGATEEDIVFNFNERLDSDGNQAIVRRIKKEVVGLEGEDKFTESEMSDSIRQYFISRRDDNTRRKKDSIGAHRNKNKIRRRLMRKLNKRQSALSSANLKEQHRERLSLLFKRSDAVSFMSSEESEAEDEQPPNGPRSRVTKSLPWESKRLRKLKKKLDKTAHSSLNESQRRLCGKVSRGGTVSQRPLPRNAPEWAVSL